MHSLDIQALFVVPTTGAAKVLIREGLRDCLLSWPFTYEPSPWLVA